MTDRDGLPERATEDRTDIRTRFWARYDKLADRHDADMLKRLNENLDVLLIFVRFSLVGYSKY